VSESNWQKSSFSGGGGNNCIEVAPYGEQMAIRESTRPDSIVTTDIEALRTLLFRVKAGHLDLTPFLGSEQ
jgi:hypothetical protein